MTSAKMEEPSEIFVLTEEKRINTSFHQKLYLESGSYSGFYNILLKFTAMCMHGYGSCAVKCICELGIHGLKLHQDPEA